MALQIWNTSCYSVNDVALVGAIVVAGVWIALKFFERWNKTARQGIHRPPIQDVEKKPSPASKVKKSDRKPGGMGTK